MIIISPLSYFFAFIHSFVSPSNSLASLSKMEVKVSDETAGTKRANSSRLVISMPVPRWTPLEVTACDAPSQNSNTMPALICEHEWEL